jgi:hypothetical protein
VTWSTGDECDRSGVAQYVHCIRGADDPERLSRKEQRARGAGFDAWREDMKGEPAAWAERIVELLGDGTPRTFNRIVLELTGCLYTADVALGKAPDEGLWLAVADRRLKHTLEAPILFAANR